MRVYVEFPDSLLETLQDQARAAHRPPRYQLEWIIQQALREPPAHLHDLADAQEVQDADQR